MQSDHCEILCKGKKYSNMWWKCHSDPISGPRGLPIGLKCQLNVLSDMGGLMCYAISLHSQSIPNTPTQKYVKQDQYEHRYRLL